MDSLVSAARTLIDDRDHDGEGGDIDVAEDVEDQGVPDETPARRRGTRRRAVGTAPESPAPKRRRVSGATDDPSTASPVAGPSSVPLLRRGKAAARALDTEEKPKPKARGKGKGKEKEKAEFTPQTRAATPDTSAAVSSVSGSARMPHAPQVARIRSALDVLADQAAQEQERRPSIDPASRRDSESECREEDANTEATQPLSPDPDAGTAMEDVFVVEQDPPGPSDTERDVEGIGEQTDIEPEANEVDTELDAAEEPPHDDKPISSLATPRAEEAHAFGASGASPSSRPLSPRLPPSPLPSEAAQPTGLFHDSNQPQTLSSDADCASSLSSPGLGYVPTVVHVDTEVMVQQSPSQHAPSTFQDVSCPSQDAPMAPQDILAPEPAPLEPPSNASTALAHADPSVPQRVPSPHNLLLSPSLSQQSNCPHAVESAEIPSGDEDAEGSVVEEDFS
ncbi:hypothetical protein BN946_scf184759.g35 [Trametes cinnabarina]|uniref:Uncharacterized protein n=1 Tax=Pycnoporus cinnabarinus TaxID=5643 RepID=A0A060S5G5_PYCCI|nr:hypothetical protein BN946_scf184759.g35 [Trametes cinnabarina]